MGAPSLLQSGVALLHGAAHAYRWRTTFLRGMLSFVRVPCKPLLLAAFPWCCWGSIRMLCALPPGAYPYLLAASMHTNHLLHHYNRAGAPGVRALHAAGRALQTPPFSCTCTALQVRLVCAHATLLDRMEPQAKEFAAKWLHQNGVEVLTGTRIRWAEPGTNCGLGWDRTSCACVHDHLPESWSGVDGGWPHATPTCVADG